MPTDRHALMTRRRLMANAAAGASIAAMTNTISGTAAAQGPSKQKTFVLIHGAFHGGWCWRRVADRLEAQGHKVFAPSLTGLGDRSHLMSKDVVLDTHIADIVNLVLWEDLKDVCLVAHSYGGWPVSGALEKVLDRVASVVFLDAFVPLNGERSFDGASEFSRKGTLAAIERGEFSRPPPKAEQFFVNEADRAWVDAKMSPQPVGVAMQPIVLIGAREKVAKKAYVRAPIYPQALFDKAYAAAKSDPSWRTFEVDGGHDVMIDRPDRLVEILLQVS